MPGHRRRPARGRARHPPGGDRRRPCAAVPLPRRGPFDVELGRGAYDLAIAGNLCHLFDEAANRRLLGRLYDALGPGGTLAVMDVIPDQQPTPRWAALYELGLLLRTASGRVHPLAAYLAWLQDAGFGPPERHRLIGQAQGVLLVARKPAGG
ncbi:MAG TPA: methyltransferase [Actinomycetota bacterium]|nr:methyltransferase [Actinomycetota bacterium]